MPDQSYTHVVRLFPQGNYFFGDENYSDSEQRAFYFQKSRRFPQQTTVLGLIRYQLLLQNGMLESVKGRKRINSNRAAAFIGDASFAPLPKESSAIPGFGVIEALSPIFLLHEIGSRYAPFPMCRDWEADENKWANSEQIFHQPALEDAPARLKASIGPGNRMDHFPHWGTYDVKKGIEWGFRNLEDGTFLPSKAVFEETEPQIGIYKTQKLKHRRQKDDRPEREGFFKMHHTRMKAPFGMEFYLQLDPLQEIQFESQAAVVMGKERSVFRMKVDRLAKAPPSLPSPNPQLNPGAKIWLASPARLDLTRAYAFCQQVITREISFRCIQTSVHKTNNYHGKLSRDKQNGNPLLSSRYNLLDAGSLLVLKDDLSKDDLHRLAGILSDPVFSAIGYNHYLTY